MSYLYVMERSDLPGVVKIGRSEDPERRARTLAQAHLFTMRVVHVIPDRQIEYASEIEALVHRELGHAREPGNSREWFRLSADVAACIIWRVYAQFEVAKDVQVNRLDSMAPLPFEIPADLPPPSATIGGRPWKPGRRDLLARMLSGGPICSMAEHNEARVILESLKQNLRQLKRKYGCPDPQVTANYVQVQRSIDSFVIAHPDLACEGTDKRKAVRRAFHDCKRHCGSSDNPTSTPQ